MNREFKMGHSDLTDAKPGIYDDVQSVEFGQNVIIFKKAKQEEMSLLSRIYRYPYRLVPPTGPPPKRPAAKKAGWKKAQGAKQTGLKAQ